MRSLYLLACVVFGQAFLASTAPANPAPAGSNTIVRIEIDRGTNRLGSVDVELFDQDKPETVRNFLLHIRSGAYSNSFLHRCVPGFIVQGGGFAVTNPLSAFAFSSFLEVTNFGRLTNEFAVGPRLTNLFGTIAMAKVGNDPNSATSQWFFNLADNSSNLDNQNGGFTVFGRVLPGSGTGTTNGTNVLLHFNSLAPSAGIVSISGQSVFSEVPVSYTNSTAAPEYRQLYHTRFHLLGETNVSGTTPPTIGLNEPASGSRFTNQAVTVSGTAGDDLAVARVLYRLNGAPAEIASGTNDWIVNLNPRPGFNTVTVESIDWNGNRSTNNPSVTFFYVSQIPLNLELAGPGKVAGLTNGQILQVGSVYAATATPAKGYYFQGWTGSVSSATANLSFQVATNTTNFNLTARFTRDFFTTLAGSYQGLIRETNVNATPGLENSGFVTLSLSRRGGFSGRIRHRNGSYTYTGRFDRNGATFLQGNVGGVNRTITLRLDTTNAAGVIRGVVSGSSSSTVEIQLERLAQTLLPTNCPSAGDYPFVVAPPTSLQSPYVPGGNGFGRVMLSSRGLLKLQGTLGDGSPFVGTAKPSRSPRWPFYLSLSRGQGAVQGWIAAETNELLRLESRLTWMRAADALAATYPVGFSNQVNLSAQLLQAPSPGQRYLNWVTGLARMEGANLVLGLTNSVRLNSDNSISVPDPNPSGLQLHLDLNTGLVDGSFVHPWIGTTNLLRGALFKAGEGIRGQFKDGDQTGSFTVNLAPFLATQMLANVTLEGFKAAISEGGLIRFENDGLIELDETVTLPYATALDANGHQVEISGAGAHRLFIVSTNQSFSAVGITFSNGRQVGPDGASSDPPEPGSEACGAGVLNLGGTIGFTNCVFTNFVAIGGAAGTDTGSNGLLMPGGRAIGAAICNRGGRATLQDCLLVDSLAIAGAGTSPPLTNRLSSLAGSAMGGAIYSDGPELTLSGTSFQHNQARGAAPWLLPDNSASRFGFVAGGAVAAAAGSLRISSNRFQTNLVIASSVAADTAGVGSAYGGALLVESNVTAVIESSVFSGNQAIAGSAAITSAAGEARGGAIYGAGALQLRDCTLEYNTVQGASSDPPGPAKGGAIAAVNVLTLTNSTLHHNLAQGGLCSSGTPAGLSQGGAVHIVRSNLSVLNSTFAYNQALSGPEANGSLPDGLLPGDRSGGAIAAISNLTTMASVTFAFNSAGSATIGSTNNGGTAGGGAIANLSATVFLRASLLVSNAPANHLGALSDSGFNFSSDASVALVASTGLPPTNANVLLGPLTDNGGPTLTMSLGLGSPARDRIPTNNLPSLVDQRGVRRPQPVGGFGDAGAVEAELTNAAPVFVPPFLTDLSVRAGSNVTLQATAVATNSISYFWIKNGAQIPDRTNTALILPNIQPTNAGLYALVATNFFGMVTSSVASLTVDATPLITNQPVSLVLNPNADASFIVRATPTNGLSYFWFHNGQSVGTNSATLAINNAAPDDRGSYQVVVSNAFGVVTSQVATLTFSGLALQLLTQPSNLTLAEGQNANFAVVASGFPVITYQWFFGENPLPGGTTNILTITNISAANVGTYRVVVTNAYLSLTSSPASLTLNLSAPPAFLRHPSNGVARFGGNFAFHAFASGTSPVTYEWLYEGTPIAAATESSLVLTNVQLTDAGRYAAIARNNFGNVTSVVATLSVDAKPRILVEPSDLVVAPGESTNFLVQADGPGLVYQWWRDAVAIVSATNDALQVSNASSADRGTYRVVITNDFGSTTSRVASLSFNTNALAILTQPTNLVATTGQVASFTVVVGGIPPYFFQWTFAGGSLADETNDVLLLAEVVESNAGAYQVIVTNAYLSVTSVVATLTVETNTALVASAEGLRLSISQTNDVLVLQCLGAAGTSVSLLQNDRFGFEAGANNSWRPVATAVLPATGEIRWTLPRPPDGPVFYRAVIADHSAKSP